MLYPTRDHVIPFREFWSLYVAMGSIEAKERINQFRAIGNALSCMFAEKGTAMPAPLREDLRAAYLALPE